jgi:hypothetical protein
MQTKSSVICVPDKPKFLCGLDPPDFFVLIFCAHPNPFIIINSHRQYLFFLIIHQLLLHFGFTFHAFSIQCIGVSNSIRRTPSKSLLQYFPIRGPILLSPRLDVFHTIAIDSCTVFLHLFGTVHRWAVPVGCWGVGWGWQDKQEK